MSKRIVDNFASRCRSKTKAGRRCKRRAKWLVQDVCVSRENWLAALKTGWPRMVRGMKSPEFHCLGFCRQHHHRNPKGYIYGIGIVGKPPLDASYDTARLQGDNAVRAQGFNA